MSKQAEQIQVLLEKSKAAAPEITNPLKVIGNGDMLEGVKKLYGHALNEGEKSGIIKGCVATTLIFGVCTITFKGVKFIKRKYQNNKLLKQNGEEIIQAFNENLIVDEPSKANIENNEVEAVENTDKEKLVL